MMETAILKVKPEEEGKLNTGGWEKMSNAGRIKSREVTTEQRKS